MERPEQSFEEYLDSLDPASRERVIQQESRWDLQPPEATPPGPKAPASKNRRRGYVPPARID